MVNMSVPESRDTLLELQWNRLQEQLDWVFENSAFYRRKYSEAGIARGDIKTYEDFQRLPLTTKEELRADQEEFAPLGSNVCVPRTDIVWLPSTSGSTGRPLILPRTKADIESWTALAERMTRMNGVLPGDSYQLIMAFQWIFTGMILHQGVQAAGATSINSGMGNTERQIWTLRNLRPRAVFATPAYFMHLAAELERRGEAADLDVQVAISGGEIGANLPAWKRLLKSRIPSITTVCDVGGVTEVGTPIWSECVHEAGAHVFEDAVYLELLDVDTQRPVPQGEQGEVVYTDLISKAAPLIRYQVRDIARFTDEPCACGLPFGRFPEGIIGRSDDMLVINSSNMFPSAIEACVRDTPGLSGEFQIVVSRRGELDTVRLRVERADNSDSSDAELTERLSAALAIATAIHPTIEILGYEELPRFVYKSKRVADERKQQSTNDLSALALSQQSM